MNQEICRLRKEELAFFAEIGAGVSHEMRNILAIIGQNAGLLDDPLALARRGKLRDPEKLKQVAARIARQVDKGIEAMERFSRFAHAADERRASVDVAALVENVTALARRHVRYDGGSLETELPDEPLPVTTNPFSLQHALFTSIQMVRQCTEKGAALTVKMANKGTAAVLVVSAAAASGNDRLSRRLDELSVVTDELEGSVETSSADGVLSLILTLPIRSV